MHTSSRRAAVHRAFISDAAKSEPPCRRLPVTYWLWSLSFWFLIVLPAAFFGITIGVVAVVRVARIVAADMTAVMEMIF